MNSVQSMAIIPYVPPIAPHEFIKEELQKAANRTYERALELERAAPCLATQSRFIVGNFKMYDCFTQRIESVLSSIRERIFVDVRERELAAITAFLDSQTKRLRATMSDCGDVKPVTKFEKRPKSFIVAELVADFFDNNESIVDEGHIYNTLYTARD